MCEGVRRVHGWDLGVLRADNGKEFDKLERLMRMRSIAFWRRLQENHFYENSMIFRVMQKNNA